MKARHIALAAAFVALAGCGADTGNGLVDAATKADKQAPACSVLFAEGASIKAAFVDYPPCKTDGTQVGKVVGDVVQYAPSSHKCADGRWLYSNALAWGYSDGVVHVGALPANETRGCVG